MLLLEAGYYVSTYLLALATVTTTVISHHQYPANRPPPVSVQVMSESLCIDCQRFFKHDLIPAYRTLGPSVMDLQVVPFGNSRIDFEAKTVTCQHGEAECDANIWEQCAVEQGLPEVYVNFFDCLEDVLPMGHKDDPFEESIFEQCASLAAAPAIELKSPDTTKQQPCSLRATGTRTCTSTVPTSNLPALVQPMVATTTSIDFGKLKACHDDPATAWSMQVKYSKLTPPEHKFVPWVLVDHQFIDVDQQDFFQQVCHAYMARGGSHPACASEGDISTSTE